MPTEVINTVSLTKTPEFKNVKTINKNFRKIKKEHCNSLLEFLYNGGLGKWQNPFTKKFLSRESPIIISFLSRCYNMSDDSTINIHGCNLTYKKHIDKFINNEYLYVPFKKKSTNSKKSNVNTQSVHFNSGGTWQPAFAPPFAEPSVQPFTQPSAQPSAQPIQSPPQQPQQSPWPQQPIQSPPQQQATQFPHQNYYFTSGDFTNLKKSKNQKSFQFYNEAIYQRYIPDDVWYLLKRFKTKYNSTQKEVIHFKDIIEMWNLKFKIEAQKKKQWDEEKIRNPGVKIKEEEEYNKREKKKKDYWNNKRKNNDETAIYRREIDSIGEIPGYFKGFFDQIRTDNINAINYDQCLSGKFVIDPKD